MPRRRGVTLWSIPAHTTPTNPPFVASITRPRVKPILIRRRARYQLGWLPNQVSPTPGAPPGICEPTAPQIPTYASSATVTPYMSRAGLGGYSATVSIPVYESRATVPQC